MEVQIEPDNHDEIQGLKKRKLQIREEMYELLVRAHARLIIVRDLK